MKRVVIDTNVYSRGLSGDAWASDILKSFDELLLSPIVLGELYSGFRHGSRETENLAILNKFILTPRVLLIDITIETSEFYCAILEQLRRDGTPIPTNDIWIAASTMEHGAHLGTLDSHFKHIAGLLCVK